MYIYILISIENTKHDDVFGRWREQLKDRMQESTYYRIWFFKPFWVFLRNVYFPIPYLC
jgi:hypothetical protein